MITYTDRDDKEQEFDYIEDVLNHIYSEESEFKIVPTELGYLQVIDVNDVEVGTIS